MIAYKQFRMDKNGLLHPLFVFSNEIIPVGEWLTAKEGIRNNNGKVLSKLGPLAYRPGWHLSEAPYAPHIGLKENGKIKYMHPNTVWAECEVLDGVNYTSEAVNNGLSASGRFDPRKACLNRLPDHGFYWFNTNPKAFGRWLIAHIIRVNRVMTDAEVEDVCWKQFGVHAQPRKTA